MGVEADGNFYRRYRVPGRNRMDGETFIVGKASGLVALRKMILPKSVASPAINLFCLATSL